MPRLSKIGAAALAAFGWTSGGAAGVTASYLVVAGGGGGGAWAGGGGGAGGYLTGTTSLSLASSYTVLVGAGGVGGITNYPSSFSVINSSSGSNSQFGSLTASVGGGAGINYNGLGGATGGSGGGGGGTAYPSNGFAGTSGQGNSGGSVAAVNGPGGGGGGAGAAGSNGTSYALNGIGGAGGAGLSSSISGTSTYYAGGGGGGSYTGTGGAGGLGGGGAGGAYNGSNGTNAQGISGTANTGGGGGGETDNNNTRSPAVGGGNGGSGVVIISYAGAQQFGGGVVTSVGGNTIHTFNTSGTLSSLSSLTASYLIVAGGAGGGYRNGGGGGAGGLLSGSGMTIDTNSTYLVTVGSGGAGSGTSGVNGVSGGNSSFSLVTTVIGGGGGGTADTATAGGSNGGSGGGGGGNNYVGGTHPAGSGTASQGNAGGTGASGSPYYSAGGGGGAGATGGNGSSSGNGGAGGAGLSSSISGTSTYYAGGGGGGSSNGGVGGVGGTGGGGYGGDNTTTQAANGLANLGAGGGGASGGGTGASGGNGGSGIVIISYAGTTQQMAGGTVTIVGGNVIHTFTTSGYLTPLTFVNNSLRFRQSNSAYLSRTMGTPTDATKMTISLWFKRGALSYANDYLIGCYPTSSASDSNTQGLAFNSNDTLSLYGFATNYRTTNQVFRDPAAWYHLVYTYDSTQSTASNRELLYINGVQITSFSTSNDVSQNTTNPLTASGSIVAIGTEGQTLVSGRYFDGQMAEVRIIDGQALSATSFGSFNAYGVWQPINYGGSYGTNGFYLPFSNTTSTTTLGYDFSPQGNNWTTNNISLTAGSTYDSMTDVPTLTSATTANYAVLNPLATLGVRATITNGNLTATGNNANYCAALSTIGITSGKFYFEATVTGYSGNSDQIGVLLSDASKIVSGVANPWYYSTDYAFLGNGNKYNNNASGGSAGAFTFGLNDVVGVAFDATAGTLQVNKNGGAFTTIYSSIPAGTYLFGTSTYATSDVIAANFGQQPFVYTPPTGYVGLNTYNL